MRAAESFFIIPFERHFEESERDAGLKACFAQPENLSGIFNWCSLNPVL